MPAPNGYAYQFPVYQPAMRLIAAITQAIPAQVTTSFAHNYQTGDIVRLIVPNGYGMVQANGLMGTITVNADTTFLIDIDTTTFTAFVIPNTLVVTVAQVVPIGEVNSKLTQATRNVLGGPVVGY